MKITKLEWARIFVLLPYTLRSVFLSTFINKFQDFLSSPLFMQTVHTAATLHPTVESLGFIEESRCGSKAKLGWGGQLYEN